jgi:hypothetical protein
MNNTYLMREGLEESEQPPPDVEVGADQDGERDDEAEQRVGRVGEDELHEVEAACGGEEEGRGRGG